MDLATRRCFSAYVVHHHVRSLSKLAIATEPLEVAAAGSFLCTLLPTLGLPLKVY